VRQQVGFEPRKLQNKQEKISTVKIHLFRVFSFNRVVNTMVL
jgi:hypothetical protein